MIRALERNQQEREIQRRKSKKEKKRMQRGMMGKIAFSALLGAVFVSYSLSAAAQAEHAKGENSALDEQLLVAARRGEIEKIKSLLNQGANAGAKDFYGFTALHCAAMNGLDSMVRTLCKMAQGVDELDMFNRTSLHLAVCRNRVGIVEILLFEKAKVDVKDVLGRTPLHWAAFWGHKRLVDILCEAGADPSKIDCNGKTPLVIALEKDFSKCSLALLRAHKKAGTFDSDAALKNMSAIAKKKILAYCRQVDFGDSEGSDEGKVENEKGLLFYYDQLIQSSSNVSQEEKMVDHEGPAGIGLEVS